MLVYNKGTQVRDLLGNVYKNVQSREYSGAEGGAAQFYPAEYTIGKRWTARYHVKGKGQKNGRLNTCSRSSASEGHGAGRRIRRVQSRGPGP
jgi:hypothetical protein